MSTPTIAEVLVRRRAEAPERPFVRFEGGLALSYGEAVDRAGAVAAAFRQAGLEQGDRVLLALDNGPAFLDAWLGCALGGLVMVPLNTRLRGALLEDVVRRARTRAVVAEGEYAELLEPLLDDPALGLHAGGPRDGWRTHDEVVARGVPPELPALTGDAPVSVIFTSGTTGPAKGAILSHAHCVARSDSYRRGLRIDETDVMFTCLPLFHNNAQMATVLVALLAGGQTAVYSRFSRSRFWTHVGESGATRFTLIGRMANLLLAAPEAPEERAHAVRSACIVPHPRGGDAFEERFGIRVVSQYYGCTEMIPMPPDLDQDRRVGSCGRPGPGHECMVADEEGRPLPDGEVGELLARPLLPEGVMSGYLDMPEATARVLHDGWYRTGDAVRRDGDGYYHLVGRLKDFIRRKGENISATEVEQVVGGHPSVGDVAAVGEPDEWGEEDVVLYVEARADASLDTDELLAFCRDRLPDFMVPARIVVVDGLPRNALGRIEKFKLGAPA